MSLPEVARQIQTYVDRGYPALAGLSEAEFRELCSPFVGTDSALLVVTDKLIPPDRRVPLLTLAGSKKPGVVDKNHFSDARPGLEPYQPLPTLGVPASPVYALLGVDRGDEFRNVKPEAALAAITERGRTGLTIDEGISWATVYPEALAKNHCFMLAGSDRGDKRMPALWISDGAPKLGWCFKGNPHTWLGVASAGGRR